MPPEIPGVPIAQMFSLTKMSPQIAGSGFAAVEHAAEEVGALAIYSTEKQREFQKLQDHVTMLAAQNEVEVDKDQIIETFRERADYENFGLDVQKQLEGINKKYQEKYGKNPGVMRLLQPHIDAQMEDVARAVEMRRLDLLRKHNLVELQKLRDSTRAQNVSNGCARGKE